MFCLAWQALYFLMFTIAACYVCRVLRLGVAYDDNLRHALPWLMSVSLKRYLCALSTNHHGYSVLYAVANSFVQVVRAAQTCSSRGIRDRERRHINSSANYCSGTIHKCTSSERTKYSPDRVSRQSPRMQMTALGIAKISPGETCWGGRPHFRAQFWKICCISYN